MGYMWACGCMCAYLTILLVQHTRAQAWGIYMWLHVYVCVPAFMFVCALMWVVCMNIQLDVCMYVRTFACMCVYVNVHVYVYGVRVYRCLYI